MDTAQQSTPAITLDQRTRVLLEAPVLPTLLKLAAPNMLVMLAQMSTGLVEVYFIARLGVDALAGASLVFPVLSLITAVSQGSVGGGVVTAIARALGRGQRAQANQLVWHAVAIAAFFGLLTSAVILSAGPLFYRAMGAEGASLAVATTYSSMVFREILRVGGMSALVSATTNLTIAIITSYVGTAGVAAIAGYGAGARLEFILVSLSYGIAGQPAF
jgi:Na+-driven multidrug efflux pump